MLRRPLVYRMPVPFRTAYADVDMYRPWMYASLDFECGPATLVSYLHDLTQVWITPQVKLTRANESGTPIDGIGSPLQIIESLGPYVTGNFIDIDEDVVDYAVVEKDGLKYYEFELFTPFALTGVHNVASVCCQSRSDTPNLSFTRKPHNLCLIGATRLHQKDPQ